MDTHRVCSKYQLWFWLHSTWLLPKIEVSHKWITSYLIKAELVKYGFSDELHKKKQTGTVALAGPA